MGERQNDAERLISNLQAAIANVPAPYSLRFTSMGRARSKADLPTKRCPVCDRPFTWRKKWEACWDEVKYCSERCRRRRSTID
ncbi:MAG: DUF2256 domain-containing protein [Leptolyngbya sp. BL-A-14]